jgi:hypothetical protein
MALRQEDLHQGELIAQPYFLVQLTADLIICIAWVYDCLAVLLG